jgi:hypothetical protein
VGTWAAGQRAAALAELLAQPAAPRTAFVVAQEAPPTTLRGAWRTVAQRHRVLGVYDASDASTAKATTTLRAALGRPGRVLRGQGPGLSNSVATWLREK